MRKKIIEFIKKYMIGLTFSLLICIVSVSAITYFDSKNVTYSNETTGMSSINVQDAVNELYNVCFPPLPLGDQILEDVPIVSSGDGLYKDEYEEGRYFYKGKNVNNYITFNNETWRIVSVEPNKTIKIMKNTSIGNRVWDAGGGTYGSTNWARPADLNTYLNSTYYSELNSIAQNQIMPKDWNIGLVTYNNNDLADQINKEKETIWNGKVALVTASEYIRSNSNQSSCGNINQVYESSNCGTTTWMHNSTSWWTLTPCGKERYVYSISSDSIYGGGYFDGSDADSGHGVRPAVYLSSSVEITGGNGSSSSPYILA